jgi:hypothetical protein
VQVAGRCWLASRGRSQLAVHRQAAAGRGVVGGAGPCSACSAAARPPLLSPVGPEGHPGWLGALSLGWLGAQECAAQPSLYSIRLFAPCFSCPLHQSCLSVGSGAVRLLSCTRGQCWPSVGRLDHLPGAEGRLQMQVDGTRARQQWQWRAPTPGRTDCERREWNGAAGSAYPLNLSLG